jgi:D-alanyl-lipoteichoic acid acyltransferase DltB (MBOAT superfamily)
VNFNLIEIFAYIVVFGFLGVTGSRHRAKAIAILSACFYIYAAKILAFATLIIFFILAMTPNLLPPWRPQLREKVSLAAVIAIIIVYILFSVGTKIDQGAKWSQGDMLGISFIALQSISLAKYNISQRSEFSVTSLFAGFAYLAFPPQMVGGPIERVEELLPQIQSSSFEINLKIWSDSFALICRGLINKAIILPYIFYAISVFPAPSISSFPLSALFFLLILPASYLYLYQDIQSYTSIAKGLGLICGVKLSDNFSYPFKAADFTDFWASWHITASAWFSENLSKPVALIFIKSSLNQWLWVAPMITFLVFGLWHGFSLSSLTAGAIMGMAFMLERKLRKEKIITKKANYFLVHVSAAVACYIWMSGNSFGLVKSISIIGIDLQAVIFKAGIAVLLLFAVGLEDKDTDPYVYHPMSNAHLAHAFRLILNGTLIGILLETNNLPSEYLKMQ